MAAGTNPNASNTDWIYQSFWRSALAADDALRQRVAFALSQIFVVSLNDANVSQHPRGVASYFDVLGRNAFGNFRTLLEDVTLHPMMGLYLSHLRNRGDSDRVPDENYAREVMQLFTIGVHQLNQDGTRVLDGSGQPVETYNNDDVTGIAKAFTGWSWAGPDTETSRFNGGGSPSNPNRNIEPMQPYPQYHSEAAKTFLGGTCSAGTMPRVSLTCALDRLFMHSNVGPFIGRQLIQRLVTSNPSPAYVARVAAAFADNGQGVRGDMKAVLRRILLDPEARNAPAPDDSVFGSRAAAWWRLNCRWPTNRRLPAISTRCSPRYRTATATVATSSWTSPICRRSPTMSTRCSDASSCCSQAAPTSRRRARGSATSSTRWWCRRWVTPRWRTRVAIGCGSRCS